MDSLGGCRVGLNRNRHRKSEKARDRGRVDGTEILAKFYSREEMEILADFAKGGGVYPRFLVLRLYWKEIFPCSCETNFYNSVCFPQGLQLFLSSLEVSEK